MKDDKHVVKVCAVNYFVQRTFSNDVAIYVSVKPGVFVHVSERLESGNRKGLGINSICAGLRDQDECFILAHFAYDNQSSETQIVVDGRGYAVDLTRDKTPAVFLSSGDTFCDNFYNIRDYGKVARSVASPEDILLRPEYGTFNRRGQVVICANAQLSFD